MISARLVGNGDADLPAPELGDVVGKPAEGCRRFCQRLPLVLSFGRGCATILAPYCRKLCGLSFARVCSGYHRRCRAASVGVGRSIAI